MGSPLSVIPISKSGSSEKLLMCAMKQGLNPFLSTACKKTKMENGSKINFLILERQVHNNLFILSKKSHVFYQKVKHMRLMMLYNLFFYLCVLPPAWSSLSKQLPFLAGVYFRRT